jgi:hypothetical protein
MDLLSDREASMLYFEPLEGLKLMQRDDLQLLQLVPILPARCFVAGVVPAVVLKGVCYEQQVWVVDVTWLWFLWVLKQALLISTEEVRAAVATRKTQK